MRYMSISLNEILYNNFEGDTMRLRDLREDAELKQQELAEYLHIRQNTYSQYENGQRQLPIEVLIKLSKFYKVSTDYILGLTKDK